jgi:hypothetical protein
MVLNVVVLSLKKGQCSDIFLYELSKTTKVFSLSLDFISGPATYEAGLPTARSQIPLKKFEDQKWLYMEMHQVVIV